MCVLRTYCRLEFVSSDRLGGNWLGPVRLDDPIGCDVVVCKAEWSAYKTTKNTAGSAGNVALNPLLQFSEDY